MTAKSEPTSGFGSEPSSLWPIIRAIAASVIALALSGAAAGAGMAMASHSRPDLRGIALVAILAALALAAFVYAWLQARTLLISQPVAPTVRRSRTMLMLSALVGAVLGIALIIGGGPDATVYGLFATPDTVLPLWLAALLFILIGLVTPWITWVWLRAADEHEVRAYRDGALWGYHAYLLLGALWWIAWKAQITAAPDGTVLFAVVAIVSSLVWVWRRYR
jgi:hypothetical protein